MELHGVEIDTKLRTASQRCRALRAQTSKLENQQYASPGADVVKHFVETASHQLLEFLQAEATNPELGLLDLRERETRIHRTCRLVPSLYQILGILSGAEINLTPAELVPSLRRSLRKILPNAEILLRSGPDLNYSIFELANHIRLTFSETPLAVTTEELPNAIYVMSIPTVEANDVLLHAILAHEAGHGIYDQKKLADLILPKIDVPKEEIRQLARAIASEKQGSADHKNKTMSFPLQEITLKDLLTQVVTGTISSWVTELTCDVLGVVIFGPACFFAFVHLFSTVAMLDEASQSHPPPRLRIRLMCSCLRSRFRLEDVDPGIDNLIKKWEEVGRKDIEQIHPAFSLALKSMPPQLLALIEDVGTTAVSDTLAYSNSQLLNDVGEILPLLKENVPSVEVVTPSSEHPRLPEMAHLLNAGWVLQLARFQEFLDNLPPRLRADADASQKQLNKLLLKSFELVEIKRRWTEVAKAVKEGQ